MSSAAPEEIDWQAMTADELTAYAEAENARRSAPEMRAYTGMPDPGAVITWEELPLPGRRLPVRVLRPAAPQGGPLPLVVHVHGSGFVGTAVQCDWITSAVAARLPAVVVSVEHRLVSHDLSLTAGVDDGWDALAYLVHRAGSWGIDPARLAVFGESTGGLITALAAHRARDSGLPLRAQVLVNPLTDVTETAMDHPSVTEYARTPRVTADTLRFLVRLGAPAGTDARALSPLYADDLGGLAPTLVVLPTHDPVEDHGRRYAERLRAAGSPVRLTEYPEAGHAFLSLPGLVPQAEDARAEILEFLGSLL